MAAFLIAAACDPLGQPNAESGPLQKLAARVCRNLDRAPTEWLWEGRFQASFGDDTRWTVEYQPRGHDVIFSLGDRFYGMRPMVGGSSRSGSQSLAAIVAQRIEGLSEAAAYRQFRAVLADPTALASEADIQLQINTSHANWVSHRRLFDLAGHPEARSTNLTLDPGWVFDVLLGHQVIWTANARNVRSRAELGSDLPRIHEIPPDGVDLARYLHAVHTANGREGRSLYAKIQKRFHTLTGRDFEVEELRDAKSVVIVVTDGVSQPRDLDQCGAGMAEALFLSVALSTPGKVLLFDEPATQFHPGLQRRLLGVLTRTPNQVIMVTHSQLLLPADRRVLGASRIVLTRRGTTRYSWSPHSDEGVDRVLRELRKSSDVGSMLFADAVVLTEGETELGAFPIWDEKVGTHLMMSNVALMSVGGDGGFRRYFELAHAYHVPWTVFCDGPVIGDGEARCAIADQLENAGVPGVPQLDGLAFSDRVFALRRIGVFTLAPDARSELEDHPCIREALNDLTLAEQADKIRAGRLVAEAGVCEHVVARIQECRRMLASKARGRLLPMAGRRWSSP
jgi:hypothetical protein